MQPIALARLGAVTLALSAASSLLAQPAESPAKSLLLLVGEARAARIAGDHPRWLAAGGEALARAPEHPDLLISVSRANAALGNDSQALDLLRRAVDRGAGLDAARFAEYERLRASPEFQAIAERGRANLRAVARAEPFAILPAQAEGIAYDPVSRRLFVGTEDGVLLQIDPAGQVSQFVSGNGLRQVLGLKVDAGRRLLWAVTGRFPDLIAGADSPPEAGTTGLYAFHLDSGARLAAHDVDERPVLSGFNDVALARDGTVYVTDSARGAIFVLPPGADALRPLLRDPAMSFPNGIVLSPDERRLYVAHVEGISLIDPQTGARTLLPPPPDAALNSIDGLAWHDGALLGVQPTPYLHRVVRIRLSPDGRGVAAVETVNSRTPGQFGQTTAAVGDNDLYVVGGFPSPDVHGGPTAEPRPQVWRIPLS